MRTFQLPAQSLPLDDGWDVIVAGGGPAGCMAAVAAAREGARVLLMEAMSALGGMGTLGLVPAWCPFSDHEQMIYRGLAERVFTESKAGVPHEPAAKMDWVAINPEHLKRVYDDMVAEVGVTVRFHTQVAAVDMEDGIVRALVLASKDGLTAVSGRVYVDCTGDGDLAAWAGAPFEKGDADGALQPATHCFMLSNVDSYAYTHGSRPNKDFLHAHADTDKYPLLADMHLCNNLIGPATVGFNTGHLWGVDNTDAASLSRALTEGRKVARQFRDALAEYYPAAFGNAYLAATGALLGIRETRRIQGDYVLTIEDYLARRGFDDEIARNSYPVDIHTAQHEIAGALRGEVHAMARYERFGHGESHGIPYRSLVPRNLVNVLVAGRCISTDRAVQGSTRVMPVALVTGEAAGLAAALASLIGDVRAVDTTELRARLRGHGAWLP